MKIYISVDMEGIGGIVEHDQVSGENPLRHRARELLTGEVNAAVEGAIKGGAKTVWVNENHSGRELLLEKLHPGAEAFLGHTKPLETLDGLDRTFDGVFLVGIHARSHTPRGNLAHTWWPGVTDELRVNGEPIGEIGLNAYLAGHFGVPVLLTTSDDTGAAEAEELLGNVETVTVKWSRSRSSARCLPPERARELIRKGAERAAKGRGKRGPLDPGKSVRFEIDFCLAAQADRACIIPVLKRTGPRTVLIETRDFEEAVRWFFASTALGGRAE